MIRDRIVELRRVRARDLLPNPKNWRKHPAVQASALRAMLEDIGYADALLVRETPVGLMLIDGHLRAERTPDEEVPVLVLDVSDAEADKLLVGVLSRMWGQTASAALPMSCAIPSAAGLRDREGSRIRRVSRWGGVLVVMGLILLSACGRSTVTITGLVEPNPEGPGCLNDGGTDPHYSLVFSNGTGEVVGSTVVYNVAWAHKTIYGVPISPCAVSALYRITVPQEDFYKVTVQGIAEQPLVVSYPDLASRSFHFDLSVAVP